MSTRQHRQTVKQERSWAVCVGDFAILKEFLAEKDTPIWIILQLLESLLRGFGQVVCANNPLSGLLIVIALAVTEPGRFALSTSTALLGLLLSVLTQDSRQNIENGITVFNPLLIGAASQAFIPKFYGSFDSFSYLLVLLGTIISVYLARSLGAGKYPCTTWPFNLVQFSLLFALAAENNSNRPPTLLAATFSSDNATSNTTIETIGFMGGNATDVTIDWGLVFRGIVLSASEVYVVENAAFGSIVYLAILIYSPTTAGFCFLGALIGAFLGLQLGVPLGEIYSGLWGYNGLLTGAALGGNLLVLNAQTAAATLVAIVYTIVVQYTLYSFFKRIDLPVLSLPFVVVVSLFLKLRESPSDAIFPRPISASFPEKQRYDYHARNRAPASAQSVEPEEFQTVVSEEEKTILRKTH